MVNMYLVWNITSSGISVDIVIVLMLDHFWFVLNRSKRHSFYPEHQTSLWPIWPLQWMLWILPRWWSSWCMRLITRLYFLLRLQISADVTVLPPVCLHGVHRDISLLPLCWRNGSINHMNIILSRTKWGRYGVMEQCVILQFCVVSKHRMLLCDERYPTGMVGNLFACWFSFCVIVIYFLCGLFICTSALTTAVWTLDMGTSSLCFLKFRWCDMFWPVVATISSIF
jgi:hypothetical protein